MNPRDILIAAARDKYGQFEEAISAFLTIGKAFHHKDFSDSITFSKAIATIEAKSPNTHTLEREIKSLLEQMFMEEVEIWKHVSWEKLFQAHSIAEDYNDKVYSRRNTLTTIRTAKPTAEFTASIEKYRKIVVGYRENTPKLNDPIIDSWPLHFQAIKDTTNSLFNLSVEMNNEIIKAEEEQRKRDADKRASRAIKISAFGGGGLVGVISMIFNADWKKILEFISNIF